MSDIAGNFGDWLAAFLVAEGRFSSEEIADLKRQCTDRKVSLPYLLEAKGLSNASEMKAYYERYRRSVRGAPKPEDDAPILPEGTEIGGYRIISLIGVGGMGVVYRAEQVSLQRPVAIKILKPDRMADEEYRSRFLNEARLAAELSHRNIVKVYEAGQFGDNLFIAMELVDGRNLQQVLDSGGRMPSLAVARILTEISAALSYAELKAIVHGDVKPANIMVDVGGAVKLADLGLAKRKFDRSTRLFGTYRYISPEVILTGKADIRSDIYSLGATAYHLLTGIPPFEEKPKEEVLDAHLAGDFPNPTDVVPDVHPALSRFVRWTTQLSPGDRPQHPDQIPTFLNRGLAVPLSEREPRVSDRVRTTSYAGPIGFALLCFVIALVGFWFMGGKELVSGPTPTPRTSPPISIPSPSPTATPEPETDFAQQAKALFTPEKGNFAEVLQFIARNGSAASPADAVNLKALSDQLFVDRDSLLQRMIIQTEGLVADSLKSNRFREALTAAASFSIPDKWGVPDRDTMQIEIRTKLEAKVEAAFLAGLASLTDLAKQARFVEAEELLEALKFGCTPKHQKEVEAAAVNLAAAEEARNVAERNASKAAYAQALKALLADMATGEVAPVKARVEAILKDAALAAWHDDIATLESDAGAYVRLLNAYYESLAQFEKSGEIITVEFASKVLVKGAIKKIAGKYNVIYKDRGLDVRLSLVFNLMSTGFIYTMARKGGFDGVEDPMGPCLLSAAREKWEEVWPAMKILFNNAAALRWHRRFSLVAPNAPLDFAGEREKLAEDLYAQMLAAYEKGDLQTAGNIALRLLDDLQDTRSVSIHLASINEILRQARDAMPRDSFVKTLKYDFSTPEQRADFFYAAVNAAVGDLSFDVGGKVSVGKGTDGLLLFRRQIVGTGVVEFDFTISKGCEIAVALKTDQLGGGIIFSDAGFGLAGREPYKYKFGGKRARIEWTEGGILVTVDGKQTQTFQQIGGKNECLAIYMNGKEAALFNLRITGKFSNPLAAVDEIMKYFDVLFFADKKNPKDKEKK